MSSERVPDFVYYYRFHYDRYEQKWIDVMKDAISDTIELYGHVHDLLWVRSIQSVQYSRYSDYEPMMYPFYIGEFNTLKLPQTWHNFDYADSFDKDFIYDMCMRLLLSYTYHDTKPERQAELIRAVARISIPLEDYPNLTDDWLDQQLADKTSVVSRRLNMADTDFEHELCKGWNDELEVGKQPDPDDGAKEEEVKRKNVEL